MAGEQAAPLFLVEVFSHLFMRQKVNTGIADTYSKTLPHSIYSTSTVLLDSPSPSPIIPFSKVIQNTYYASFI